MNKQKGLSIVELMISITLGLLLMSGVVQVFLSSKNTFSTQQGMSRIQETGRLAMEFVGRDLRMASHYGCVNTINPTIAASSIDDPISAGLTGFHKDFAVGLRGYNATSTANADKLPASLGGSFTLKSGSDVLVIRGASERGIPFFKANTQTKVYGYSPENSLNSEKCVDGFCKEGIAVLSNCERGRFFKISADPAIASHMVTLTHSDSWDLSSAANNNYLYGNIFPVHTIVYFVATSTANTLPALWQKFDDDSAPVELLQGIEDMHITYSGDSGTPGTYREASAVTDWNKISSLRIEFLVRGSDAKNLDDIQPYVFRGATVTPTLAKDKVVRQVFNATFTVRSRVN